MNTRIATAIFWTCGLALAAPAWSQHPHGHEVAEPSPPVAPAPALRWATDAPLREGMARLHVALEQLARYEMGQSTKASALERAADVEKTANYMFTHCKLEPEPDAVLHRMLVPMLAALQQFRDNPDDVDRIDAMRMAIADYPYYFDDPGFLPPGAEVLNR